MSNCRRDSVAKRPLGSAYLLAILFSIGLGNSGLGNSGLGNSGLGNSGMLQFHGDLLLGGARLRELEGQIDESNGDRQVSWSGEF
jgi:hypothetical protein